MLEIASGTAQRMRKLKDQCILRIVDSDDLNAATEVLNRFRHSALSSVSSNSPSSVNFVSEVMQTPDGPMVIMDAKDLTSQGLDRILGDIVGSSVDLGLSSGRLEVPQSGRLVNELPLLTSAIVGAALPPAAGARTPRALPGPWRPVAADWVRTARFEPLVAEVVSVEARLDWATLDTYIDSSGPWGFRVSSGSVKDGLCTSVGRMPIGTRLALMSGGLSFDQDDFDAQAERLRATIQKCAAEAAYIYVTPVDGVARFGAGDVDVPGRPADHPGGLSGYLTYLSDVQVLDAFWYQVLGPGHVARVGTLPGAVEIGDGKVELTLGEPEDWLDPERAQVLQARGRSLLEPCFIGKAEGRALISERRAASRRS